MHNPIRVLIADDHPLILIALREVIDGEPGLECVATARSGAEAIRLYQQYKPDVLMMDLQMSDMTGLDALREVRKLDPNAKVIILSSFACEVDVFQALEDGARAYLLKDADASMIGDALRAVGNGRKYLPAVIASTLANRFDSDVLSPREQEVLGLLANGQSNKIIARSMGISEGTTKFHLNNIFEKLGVNSRTAAMAAAVRRGLIRM